MESVTGGNPVLFGIFELDKGDGYSTERLFVSDKSGRIAGISMNDLNAAQATSDTIVLKSLYLDLI